MSKVKSLESTEYSDYYTCCSMFFSQIIHIFIVNIIKHIYIYIIEQILKCKKTGSKKIRKNTGAGRVKKIPLLCKLLQEQAISSSNIKHTPGGQVSNSFSWFRIGTAAFCCILSTGHVCTQVFGPRHNHIHNFSTKPWERREFPLSIVPQMNLNKKQLC